MGRCLLFLKRRTSGASGGRGPRFSGTSGVNVPHMYSRSARPLCVDGVGVTTGTSLSLCGAALSVNSTKTAVPSEGLVSHCAISGTACKKKNPLINRSF